MRYHQLLRDILILFILIGFIHLYEVPRAISSQSNVVKGTASCSSSDYISHDPIKVSSDTELASIAVRGNGSQIDPYILEGWSITTSGVHGIYIHHTTKYFIVQNCWLEIARVEDFYGIYIRNIADGTALLFNNICKNSDIGIKAERATDSIIANNSCFYNNQGLHLDRSGDSLVANNTIRDNFGSGISLQSSENTTLLNNVCHHNIDAGIELYSSESSTIINNTFFGDGLFVSEEADLITSYQSYNIIDNRVNNRPLGWFTNLYNLTLPSSYGQLFLINCSNVTVTNLNCSNTYSGIIIYYSYNCRVLKSIFTENRYYGIHVINSEHTTIVNNSFHRNRVGVYFTRSGSCLIVNNTFLEDGLMIVEGDLGSYLSYTVVNNWMNGLLLGYLTNLYNLTLTYSYGQLFLINCTRVVVQNQNCSYAYTGITLLYSNFCQLLNNTCHYNLMSGIYLQESEFSIITNNTCSFNTRGINLSQSGYATISNNICTHNFYHGISLFLSKSSTIFHNTCNNSTNLLGSGIFLSGSEYSVVADNACFHNNCSSILIKYSEYSTISGNICHMNEFGINIMSSFITAINNTCKSNKFGIYLDPFSTYCLINNNTLIESQNYGIGLGFSPIYWVGSENNTINYNRFLYNYNGAIQACDNGSLNQWINNYWSDYSGSGAYIIDGTAGAKDLNPIDEHGSLIPQVPETTSEISTTDFTTSSTGKSQSDRINLPYFIFFLITIGIFGHYRRK